MNSTPLSTDRMLGALLRLPSRAIVRRIARDLARAGHDDLSPAQFVAFQYLPPEGARTTELAEQAGITKQSMSALVRALISQGYLERLPDPTDRRASIVVRTERGWEIERIARTAISALVDEWRDALAPGQLDAGIEMLGALADHLDAQEETERG
ncbi:MAG: MarR family winged helix-turn-helix transcriptional regulator [Thermomicrobiales bacterium]